MFFKTRRSGSIAHERLNRLLISDRLSRSPVLVEHIREDLCRILSKYNEINITKIEIELIYKNKNSQLDPSLLIHIPFNQNTQEKSYETFFILYTRFCAI